MGWQRNLNAEAKDDLPMQPNDWTGICCNNHDRKCNRAHPFDRKNDGIWCQQLDTNPIVSLPSNFEVAAAVCCRNPLTRHYNTTPSTHHIRERQDRCPEVIDRKVIQIPHGEHTSDLWPRKNRPAAICFPWWGQITAIRLQNFRILRPSRLIKFSSPSLFWVGSFLTFIWFFCIQEAATASPWSTHCMKVAWKVQIWL